MVKIIEEYHSEDGALIKCKCGIKQFIFLGSEKDCSCGRSHIIKVKVIQVKSRRQGGI